MKSEEFHSLNKVSVIQTPSLYNNNKGNNCWTGHFALQLKQHVPRNHFSYESMNDKSINFVVCLMAYPHSPPKRILHKA